MRHSPRLPLLVLLSFGAGIALAASGIFGVLCALILFVDLLIALVATFAVDYDFHRKEQALKAEIAWLEGAHDPEPAAAKKAAALPETFLDSDERVSGA